MSTRLKNVLIGSFFIVAAGLIVWMIFFIKPTVGNGKQKLYARFSNVTMISKGTRVTVEGFPVGEVEALYPIPNARTHPVVDAMGNLYYYQATLRLDSSVKVYTTDEVAIKTYGLLGEKSIVIEPRPAPPHVKPQLVTEKTPIYVRSLSELDRAFHEMTGLAQAAKTTFTEVNGWLCAHGEGLAHALSGFGSAMEQLTVALQAFNSSDLLQEATEAVTNVNGVVCRILEGLDTLQATGTFANIGSIAESMKSTLDSIAHISQHIAEGRGTLGKLVEYNDVYMELQGAMNKFNALMQDINTYGLFFYQNKTWMRLRAQRALEMEQLQKPEHFKRFCENQIQEIQTSMHKLAQLIEGAKGENQKEVLENQSFRKDFSEFLDRVDELSHKLKMYNDELVHIKKKGCP